MLTPVILEQLPRDMSRRSVAGRCHADLAWIGLGIGDELGNRFSWHRWVHHHDEGLASDAGARRDVRVEIKTKLFVQRSFDRFCPRDKKDGVAIGGRTNDRLGSDILATAGSVIDHEWLAEPL